MTDERKLLLLGLLRQKDMHGYMLNAHLGSTIPITLKKPTAYNLLKIMEKNGWIIHRDERSGDRERKVYTVTEAGEAMFFKLLRQQLTAFAPAQNPGMVSIGFLDAIPASEAVKLLKNRKSHIEKLIASLDKTNKGNGSSDNHHHGSSNLVIEFSHRSLILEMRFLDDVIKTLEYKKNKNL